MTYKSRTMLAIALVELLLAGIWFYLASLSATNPDRVEPGFQENLGSTISGAMGVFLGVGLILFLMVAKRDKGKS